MRNNGDASACEGGRIFCGAMSDRDNLHLSLNLQGTEFFKTVSIFDTWNFISMLIADLKQLVSMIMIAIIGNSKMACIF